MRENLEFCSRATYKCLDVSTQMNNNIIVFDNSNLKNIVEAFRRRSKSLKHRGCVISFTKEIDEYHERLNIDCEMLATPVYKIRFSIWNDGEAYFRTCQASKRGWKHLVELSGDLSNLEPGVIARRFENSLHLTDSGNLQTVWSELTLCQY